MSSLDGPYTKRVVRCQMGHIPMSNEMSLDGPYTKGVVRC